MRKRYHRLTVVQPAGRCDGALARRDQSFLRPLHFCGRTRVLVVEAVEMKKAMHEIKAKLVPERSAQAARLATGGLRAHKNLTVLKGDHVGRSRLLKKAPMELRHPAVRNENDAYFGEPSQHGRCSRKFQAFSQRALRELLQRDQFDRNNPLAIADSDHVNGRVSAWKFLVMSRAPLLKVIYDQAHWMRTAMRFRNPTRKMM
ncbi:MAG: hypothetical protein V7609_3360 [Verrucomicrobiota bacterium]